MDFLCLDFINSYFADEPAFGNTSLMGEAGLRRLCLKWGLPEPAKELWPVLPQLRRELDLAVREYSRAGGISAGNLAALNAWLAPVRLHNRLECTQAGFCLRQVPEQMGQPERAGQVEQVENKLLPYRLVMSFADLVSNYEASRLKICENPACAWVFYDQSKSRTRRWCDNTCASLIKVRRFRQKRAES